MNGSDANAPVGLSVVVPVFNEVGNLDELCRQLLSALGALGKSWEIIFVDDGSTDGSWEKLIELKSSAERLRLIRLRRNFGQTAALAAGFRHARGDVIVTLDADLQNDPADIPNLVNELERTGADLVAGRRRVRHDPLLSKKLPSSIANFVIRRATGTAVHDLGCTLKAFRRDLVGHLNLYGDMHRFIPVLAGYIGADIREVDVGHRPRYSGKSKYGLKRTVRVLLDVVTLKFLLSYFTRPIHIFGLWGLLVMLASGLVGLTVIYLKLFRAFDITGNPLTYVCLGGFLVGVQFIAMGLLGEIGVRTYHEAQDKPIYFIREVVD